MATFMGYELGGLATETDDLFGYAVVDRASNDFSLSGDDQALLQGPLGPAYFCNGEVRQASEGQRYSLRREDDYQVVCGHWGRIG